MSDTNHQKVQSISSPDKSTLKAHNVRRIKNKNKPPCYLHTINKCRKQGEGCKNGEHIDGPFDINKWYKSGGILAYTYIDNDAQLLVGKEEGDEWTTFGGKREPCDETSIDTCVREFCEESVAAYVPEDISTENMTPKQQLVESIAYIKNIVNKQVAENPEKMIYIPSGKFHLLIIELPFVKVDKFDLMRKKNFNSEHKITGTEKTEFDWISARGFAKHFRTNRLANEWNGKTYTSFTKQLIMNANKFFKFI
ncbi:hypothetical protein AKO1_004159 [Acrasis kona]|uniref:Nudix hydrolase domain-containing protein n=1 Tax=Acrasis kona TaxID=1008807 RepID=A0AAW2ZDM4_9EUKA